MSELAAVSVAASAKRVEDQEKHKETRPGFDSGGSFVSKERMSARTSVLSVAAAVPVAYTSNMTYRNRPAWTCATVALIGFLLGMALPAVSKEPSGPLDVEPEELRPGLWAEYRSVKDRDAALQRTEAKPAFFVGTSSPHPRLPDGPFEATWRGVIQLREPSPISFSARVGGDVTVEVDGVTVLGGRGLVDRPEVSPATVLRRPPGIYRLAIHYHSSAGVPARLQLFWEGPGFAREPLPAWRLGHLAVDRPESYTREEARARGRVAAERLGCARCHSATFPGMDVPPPGPSLADSRQRLNRDWLMRWLDAPAAVRAGARMPALFGRDRRGYVERWLIADYLAQPDHNAPAVDPPKGDHRLGRRAFLGLGCAACHLVPDVDGKEQGSDSERFPLTGLGDRLRPGDLSAFLGDPRSRYPDGRMPKFPVTPDAALDIAAYLLLWSPAKPSASANPSPSREEIAEVVRRLQADGPPAAARTLIREKGCAACHPGVDTAPAGNVGILQTADRGCLSKTGGVRFALDDRTREDLAAYLAVSPREHAPSAFVRRREALERARCVQCHQRDNDRPPPIEVAGATLGGGHLFSLPFQRTPRMTHPHQKFTRSHLVAAVREGVSGLRPATYTYRMPAFGSDAEGLVQALAEQDGDVPDAPDPPQQTASDPTLGSLAGPGLVGSQGYGCISCHVWNGAQLSQPDPGAVGPDLTRVPGRIRRDWFDRFLEGPGRFAPGTPMPAIFLHGQPALLSSVLGGDPAKQRDALWSYLAQGKTAPPPKPPPPLPIEVPGPGEPPLVAQIPIRLPDNAVVESLSLLTDRHDLLVYDLATSTPRVVMTGARILRNVQGRTRQLLASGTAAPQMLFADPSFRLHGKTEEPPTSRDLHGYDRLPDGARLRWQLRFGSGALVQVEEILRIDRGRTANQLVRELQLAGLPADAALAVKLGPPTGMKVVASVGTAKRRTETDPTFMLIPDPSGHVTATATYDLPPAQSAPPWEEKLLVDPGPNEGTLERPGYRAFAYPRPKTISGEDRIMPGALAVHPRDGRVFVASLKTAELFVLRAPADRENPRFDSYGSGLFQDALGLLAEGDALYVLHRRNLTRVVDADGDGTADRFDRVAALPHGVADTYDYAYGLARDKQGAFVLSYAPYANTQLAGSGGALRLVPGEPPKEVAYGFRNPIGWCVGPEKEVFFTDNQGEWVATNKLCHLTEGRFYGFPNSAQAQHATKPRSRPAVWVPYQWARSINGVAYDNTGGKFGPFAGQFFLAELMFGGALIRADVERVNGEYQGACFPFWGKGLMGPVSLAFDPHGPLYVGGITEPGWMAQPDRGALFRIDFTGQTPFEIRSIRVLPKGFRLVFTEPVDRASAASLSSYRVEHYRYEYTGAYGSPELDRAQDRIEAVHPSDDGRTVDLTTAALVKDRVYMISAPGIRSARGESLVQPIGAYTLNEIPAEGAQTPASR